MDKKTVLIVAGPGEVREGIEALLEAIPEIGLVKSFSPVTLVRANIKKLVPELIVLDSTHEEVDCRKLLSQLKQRLPCIKVLAIVDREEEEEICRDEGSDATLVKGFRAQGLIDIVKSLLEDDSRGDIKSPN
ncbi:hypothetical protein K9M06_02205 [Candidatus Bipolaricaulota bacterium]|nr:hypothetical protein [Candidatus Bipolaricaulota bacterium]